MAAGANATARAARKLFVESMEDTILPAIRVLGPEHRTNDVMSSIIAAAVAPYPKQFHNEFAEMLTTRIEDAGLAIDVTPDWAENNNFLASRIPALLSIPGTSVAKYLAGFAIPEKQPHLIWKRFPVDLVQIGPNRFAMCWNAAKLHERKYSNVAARNTDMHLLTEEIHEFRLLYTIAHLPKTYLLEAPRPGHVEIAVLNVIDPEILAEVRGAVATHGGAARRRRATRRNTRRRSTRRARRT